MTKQQIVVQFATAKYTQSGFLPGDHDLETYGDLADKIIAMFPEHDYNRVSAGRLDESLYDINKSIEKLANVYVENSKPMGLHNA